MSESEQAGATLFKQIADFWEKDSHEGLSPLAVENIGKVLKYIKTPEGEVAVKVRSGQLDEAIDHFNKIKQTGEFNEPFEKESKKLAKQILGEGEKLPLLSETSLDTKTVLPFLLGFRRLTSSKIHYYTFLDKSEAKTPEEFNSLITGILVDGFAGFTFRGRRVLEGRPSKIGQSDLTAVNAICEMVYPGELQTEILAQNVGSKP